MNGSPRCVLCDSPMSADMFDPMREENICSDCREFHELDKTNFEKKVADDGRQHDLPLVERKAKEDEDSN